MSKKDTNMIKLYWMLQLGTETFNGREKLKDIKLRQKKHLIATAYPVNELICATGGVPVYPIRMQKLRASTFLSMLSLGSTLFGTNLKMGLNVLEKFTPEFVGNVLNEVSNAINEKYNENSDYAENLIPADACFALKFLDGAYMQKAKNVSAIFNFPIRCTSWNLLQQMNALDTSKQNIAINVVPPYLPNSRDLIREEVNQAIARLEKITGLTCTNSKLKQVCEKTNEAKAIYEHLIFNIGPSDKYPVNVKTYAQMMALIEIAFQDYLSDLDLFLKILRGLKGEVDSLINSSQAVDVSDHPKILYVSRYGGYDSYIEEVAQEKRARLIYADWHQLGFTQQIATNGDMVDNYADYIERYNQISLDGNVSLTKRQFEIAKRLDADAVIYNQVFGCHSYTINYSLLKKRLLQELEIPSTTINFNKIGEGREQLKTRVEALLELV